MSAYDDLLAVRIEVQRALSSAGIAGIRYGTVATTTTTATTVTIDGDATATPCTCCCGCAAGDRVVVVMTANAALLVARVGRVGNAVGETLVSGPDALLQPGGTLTVSGLSAWKRVRIEAACGTSGARMSATVNVGNTIVGVPCSGGLGLLAMDTTGSTPDVITNTGSYPIILFRVYGLSGD